jgi:hypothetical protein
MNSILLQALAHVDYKLNAIDVGGVRRSDGWNFRSSLFIRKRRTCQDYWGMR